MADFELPGYELYERLGRGGMATVYRALHLNLDREVAIKVMDPSMNADETFSERFIREARISARLNHPHILQIYDVNTYNGLNYIAMELLSGGELADFIHSGMPQKQIYAILRQITQALDYASGRGYVHRDIKPSNIMLRGPDDYVLADFGIARAANSGTQMTQTGLMVGTPSYMSPEQAKGQEVDGRSDLYAMGVLTYEMLTKQLPYESDSAVTTAVKHLTEDIPTLPEKLSAYQGFIDKALAKSPEERFQTGAELYEAFMAASAGFDDDAVLTPAAEPRAKSASSTSVDGAERTSLAGADATRMSHSSSPVVSGSSRPYRLEGSEQRERLVSGAYERRQKKKGGPSAAFILLAVLLLGGGGGGYYWWQGKQQSGASTSKDVTAELARAYSAMNEENLTAAASSFYKVLSLDDSNTAARQGMEEVGRLYTAAIEKAVESKDLDRAKALLVDYGGYFASAANLGDLQSQVDLAQEELKLAAAREERIGKLLADAGKSIEAQDFDAAQGWLDQAATLDPEYPATGEMRDRLEQARAQATAYEERWSQYSEEERTGFEQAIANADSALDSGDLDAAAAALADASEIAPDAPEIDPRQERLAQAQAQAAEAELAAEQERQRVEAEQAAAEQERQRIAAEQAATAQERQRVEAEKAAAEQERKRLEAELAAAEEQVAAGKQALSNGALDVAQQAYDVVAQSHPELDSVLGLGKSLREAYAKGARDDLAQQEYDGASQYVSRGAEHFPDDPLWQQLEEEIESARTSSHRRLGVY